MKDTKNNNVFFEKIKELETKNEELNTENEDLKKKCCLFEQILNNIHEGVMVADNEYRLTYFNKRESINEGFQEDHILKRLSDLFYESEDDPTAEQVLRTGEPVFDQKNTYTSLKGETVHLLYSFFPFNYKNKIEGMYMLSRSVYSEDPYISAILSYEKKIKLENAKKKEESLYYLDNIIGNSQLMREAIEQANKIAKYNIPAMIIGETGTGKEMFAQGIHNAGNSSQGDFIAVNCAAVPETLLEGMLFGVTKGAYTGAITSPGLFEQAEDGSIFLDEVNAMPLVLQAKLLRALQEKKIRPLGGKKEISFNCRIISSSNTDPFDTQGRNAGQIKADLLFRLAPATLYIPSLRKRKEDIPVLCNHFIKSNINKDYPKMKGVSPVLLELLRQYDWPGNVRELQNLVYSCLLNVNDNETLLEVKHLPNHIRSRVIDTRKSFHGDFRPVTLRDAVADFERQIIIDVILRKGGNISAAAKELKIARANLYAKIDKLGIVELLPHSSKKQLK